MLHLLHTHWLWFFGAVALGVVAGWLTYRRDATPWTDRPVPIAIGLVGLGALLVVAGLVPGRSGAWLELGVIFVVFCAAGGVVGWALRDLADYTPARARLGAPVSAGSYLFREAHAGLGAGSAYMRTSAGDGALPRERLPLVADPLTSAPARGVYTFPVTQPFADATTSRAALPVSGPRRHWSWPRADGGAAAVAPAFTGVRGGYLFPAAVPASLQATRDGKTRSGQFRHWSWRGATAADAPVATPANATTFSVAKSTATAAPPLTPVAPDFVESSAPIPAATSSATDAPGGVSPAAPATWTSGQPGVAPADAAPVVPAAHEGAADDHASAAAVATGVIDDGRPIETPGAVVANVPFASSENVDPGEVTSGDAAAMPTSPAGLPAAPAATPGQPAVIAAVPGEEKHAGARPEGLMSARDDRADDLKRIRGIGPLNEGRLHGLGIWHFDQIGAWTPENVRWVGSYLAFPGRIDREKWVEQAQLLAAGGAVAPRKPR